MWKEAGNCKELGGDLIDQNRFMSRLGKMSPSPSNVDMTRRYSILSPPEFDRGEVRGRPRRS